jgi:hypothetical protein
MSRLQAGGLALVLNSILPSIIGRVAVLESHIGIHQSSRTGVIADAWEISVDGSAYIIRSDWLMPLGDKKTQDELAKEIEVV